MRKEGEAELPVDPFSSDPVRNRYRRVFVELVSVTVGTGVDEASSSSSSSSSTECAEPTERAERGVAYIRNSSTWESFPSNRYLAACYKNLALFWGPDVDGGGALHVYDEEAELRGEWAPPLEDGSGDTVAEKVAEKVT